MKVVILLLVCTQWVYSASIVVKRMSDGEKKNFVDDANNVRKQIANQHNVANMQEMRWDYNLESLAAHSDCKTDTGPDYVIVPDFDENGLKMLSNLSEEHQQTAHQEYKDRLSALISPVHNTIGCSEVSCTGIAGICLVGPKSSVSISDVIFGEPGSECTYGKAPSGLCRSRAMENRDVTQKFNRTRQHTYAPPQKLNSVISSSVANSNVTNAQK